MLHLSIAVFLIVEQSDLYIYCADLTLNKKVNKFEAYFSMIKFDAICLIPL